MRIQSIVLLLVVLNLGCLSDSANPMRTRVIDYNCANGAKVHAAYLTGTPEEYSVLIRVDRSHYDLKLVSSASGEKYTDGKFTWWTKGSTAFFQVDGQVTISGCLTEART